jgi:hypothetical protein
VILHQNNQRPQTYSYQYIGKILKSKFIKRRFDNQLIRLLLDEFNNYLIYIFDLQFWNFNEKLLQVINRNAIDCMLLWKNEL